MLQILTCGQKERFLKYVLVQIQIPLLLVLFHGDEALDDAVDGAVRLEMAAPRDAALAIVTYALQQQIDQILKTFYITFIESLNVSIRYLHVLDQ